MSDLFKNDPGLTSPAIRGFAIAASDTVDLPHVTRGFYVGAAGNATVIFRDDTAPVALVGLLPGVVYPFRLRRVLATGLTAANIVGVH